MLRAGTRATCQEGHLAARSRGTGSASGHDFDAGTRTESLSIVCVLARSRRSRGGGRWLLRGRNVAVRVAGNTSVLELGGAR